MGWGWNKPFHEQKGDAGEQQGDERSDEKAVFKAEVADNGA